MNTQLLAGLFMVIVAGTMAGGALTPTKFMRSYQFEHYWIIFAVTGTAIIPWGLALGTIPNLFALYSQLPWKVLVLPPVFAFSWGIASMLAGLCVSRIGLSLSYALVIGIGAAAGTLVPLLYFSPEALDTRSGHFILLGISVMLCGLLFVTRAGQQRESQISQTRRSPESSAPSPVNTVPLSKRYVFWVAMGALAGFLSAGLNFSFAFGQGISLKAQDMGCSSMISTYAIWAFAMLGGMVPNLGYPLLLCARKNSWKIFSSAPKTDIPLGALIGCLFIGSTFVYGFGAIHLGVLGTSVGWAIMQIMQIVVGNLSGFLTGEWRSARGESVRLMVLGLGILVIASVIIGFGNYFQTS